MLFTDEAFKGFLYECITDPYVCALSQTQPALPSSTMFCNVFMTPQEKCTSGPTKKFRPLQCVVQMVCLAAPVKLCERSWPIMRVGCASCMIAVSFWVPMISIAAQTAAARRVPALCRRAAQLGRMQPQQPVLRQFVARAWLVEVTGSVLLYQCIHAASCSSS